jgi:hypothetical protein
MRYCGRDFSETELTLITILIAEDPRRTRADLSRLACRAMHWLKPDGGLKDMSCRVAMLRMQGDVLIHLLAKTSLHSIIDNIGFFAGRPSAIG